MGRGRVYTYRYIVTTRMTCIMMGSDESHFNVSLGIERRSFRLPAYRLTARPNRLSQGLGKLVPLRAALYSKGHCTPSGFRGRKDLLNRASALVTTCP